MDDEDWEQIKKNNEDTEGLFDMKMEDIKKSVHDTRLNVGKIRHFQFMLGAQMSKVRIAKLRLSGNLQNIFAKQFDCIAHPCPGLVPG